MGAYSIVSLWDMMHLPIGQLIAHSHQLSALSQTVTHAVQNGSGMNLRECARDLLRDSAAGLASCCKQIGLNVSARLATEVHVLLRTSADEPQEDGLISFHPNRCIALRNALMCLTTCLEREAETKRAMILPEDQAALYEPESAHFGEEVRNKFTRAVYEIDEAAKCLALGRTTASVFHSMRVLEVGLGAVYRCLGLPQLARHERSWGMLLGRIKDNLAARGKTWIELPLFQVLYERLDAVKGAQRNNTMHVEDVYTAEDAKLVFENTRAFMAKLATRMDQDGAPIAP